MAVLVTHGHPDHYGGIVELVRDDAVPVIAAAGVDAVIRRDDASRRRSCDPCSGTSGRARGCFPSRTVSGGETLALAGVDFTVLDLGPGESPHDSIWLLGTDRRTVFAGDQVYGGKHAYLADGYYSNGSPTSSC